MMYKSVKIGEITIMNGDLPAGEAGKFSVFAGLDKKLVSKLKALSLDKKDKELQKNTGDYKRFGVGSYSTWYKKNRVPFALVHQSSGALAGIVWFGPKSLGTKSIKYIAKEEPAKKCETEWENVWHTIAFRSYPPFRGIGLAKKFVNIALGAYLKKFPHAKIWNGIYTKNIASKKLSESLGFKTLEKLSDREANWLVMVKY